MVGLDIGEVMARFPDYRVALVVAEGIAVPAERSAALRAHIDAIEARANADFGDRPPAEIEALACWRRAYRAFGVKKTSYRSSVERLVRRLQRGCGLPRVNGLVDLYNALSLDTLMPVGADDLDRITPPLAYRFARGDDSFIPLGAPGAAPELPKDGEVVYADAAGTVLCRRWNWLQDARSAIGPETRRVVINIEALAPTAARLEEAAAALASLLRAHCGGQVGWGVADRTTPAIAVE